MTAPVHTGDPKKCCDECRRDMALVAGRVQIRLIPEHADERDDEALRVYADGKDVATIVRRGHRWTAYVGDDGGAYPALDGTRETAITIAAATDRWVLIGSIDGPGIYQMSDADYHADPLRLQGTESLSVSWTKALLAPSRPAKFRWQRDHPRTSTDAFDLGHAAHALVLGAGAELVEVTEKTWATKAAKDARDAARAAGKTPLLSQQMRQVEDMAAEVARHPRHDELLTGGAAELSAFAIDPLTGVWLRARFDYLRENGIVDYKTTASADPDEFVRSAIRYGYHGQHAWYVDLAEMLDLGSLRMEFLLQEKEPPYLVAVVDLPPDMVTAGRARNREAIEVFARCLAADDWPGYPAETVTLTTPRWLKTTESLDPSIEAEFADLLKEIA